jgi:hypothetical protein
VIAGLSGYQHVLVGYLVTGALMGGYVLRVMRRARTLARQVPDEDKPWI